MENLIKKIKASMDVKENTWQEEVYNSQQYQQELKYLQDISYDFLSTLQSISLYSTRSREIYDNFLTINATDDIIQSVIAIQSLIEHGIHNTVKRELRYLIEMMTKYVIVDYARMGDTLNNKILFLKEEIPNSSIEIIDSYAPPFDDITLNNTFKAEIKDFFYKACAYVHPSKTQIDEQIKNYSNGNTIGYESAKMLADINKLTFRAYDMILVMILHGFGESMSGDIFIQVLDDNLKWKFHKAKYVKEYSKKFDYKYERQ